MPLRVRWYLCTASLTPSGRPTSAILPRVASGAHVFSTYAPTTIAPDAALVRVLQDSTQHDAMEAGAGFDASCIRLRVLALWANLPRTALLDNLLDAFGLRYNQVNETLVGGVILRLGRIIYPDFNRTRHFNPDLEQYATAED